MQSILNQFNQNVWEELSNGQKGSLQPHDMSISLLHKIESQFFQEWKAEFLNAIQGKLSSPLLLAFQEELNPQPNSSQEIESLLMPLAQKIAFQFKTEMNHFLDDYIQLITTNSLESEQIEEALRKITPEAGLGE
jgi:hypothetical protein